jgi:hypothetical protein
MESILFKELNNPGPDQLYCALWTLVALNPIVFPKHTGVLLVATTPLKDPPTVTETVFDNGLHPVLETVKVYRPS